MLGISQFFVNLSELLLDEILHGFHIVVGHLLNILHPLGILLRELTIDIAQTVKQTLVERLELRQGEFTKRYEILYLYPDTIADECKFGKIIGQLLSLASVSAIDR